VAFILSNRKKILSIIFVFLLLSYLPVWKQGTVAYEYQDDAYSITVLASSSLTDVLTELIRIYSVKGNVTVSATYESPTELADSIESGDPSDVYISEHLTKMRDLKRQGLIDVFSLTNIASNKLVFLSSVENHILKNINKNMPITELLKDINEKTLLVVGDPDNVPAGDFAKTSLSSLGYWDKIEPYIVKAGNSRNALYLISKGRSAGITYFTEAYKNPEVEIISELPEDSHDPIIYQGAVIAGENMQHARDFLNFLKSDRAREIFHKYGFLDA